MSLNLRDKLLALISVTCRPAVSEDLPVTESHSATKKKKSKSPSVRSDDDSKVDDKGDASKGKHFRVSMKGHDVGPIEWAPRNTDTEGDREWAHIYDELLAEIKTKFKMPVETIWDADNCWVGGPEELRGLWHEDGGAKCIELTVIGSPHCSLSSDETSDDESKWTMESTMSPRPTTGDGSEFDFPLQRHTDVEDVDPVRRMEQQHKEEIAKLNAKFMEKITERDAKHKEEIMEMKAAMAAMIENTERERTLSPQRNEPPPTDPVRASSPPPPPQLAGPPPPKEAAAAAANGNHDDIQSPRAEPSPMHSPGPSPTHKEAVAAAMENDDSVGSPPTDPVVPPTPPPTDSVEPSQPPPPPHSAGPPPPPPTDSMGASPPPTEPVVPSLSPPPPQSAGPPPPPPNNDDAAGPPPAPKEVVAAANKKSSSFLNQSKGFSKEDGLSPDTLSADTNNADAAGQPSPTDSVAPSLSPLSVSAHSAGPPPPPPTDSVEPSLPPLPPHSAGPPPTESLVLPPAPKDAVAATNTNNDDAATTPPKAAQNKKPISFLDQIKSFSKEDGLTKNKKRSTDAKHRKLSSTEELVQQMTERRAFIVDDADGDSEDEGHDIEWID